MEVRRNLSVRGFAHGHLLTFAIGEGPSMERRLVTILVASVVGYRRAVDLIEAIEPPHRGEAVEGKLARPS